MLRVSRISVNFQLRLEHVQKHTDFNKTNIIVTTQTPNLVCNMSDMLHASRVSVVKIHLMPKLVCDIYKTDQYH